MTTRSIWIGRKPDGTLAVCWDSDGIVRRQSCRDEDQARSFAAGLEEGLQEARRVLIEGTPRLRSSDIVEMSA